MLAPLPDTDPWLLLPFLLCRALVLALHRAVTRLASPDCRALLSLTPLATVLLSLPLAREHTGLYRLLVSGLFLAGALLLARPALLFSGHQGSLPLSFPSAPPPLHLPTRPRLRPGRRPPLRPPAHRGSPSEGGRPYQRINTVPHQH